MKAMRLIALAALALMVLPVTPAGGLGVGGPQPFGLTPLPSASGQPRPYFQLQLAPGQSTTDTIVISNDGTATVHLKLSASSGVTARNSGSAFAGYFQTCAAEACWVSGLPQAVSLAPGARKEASFAVRVPTGTPSRQYLAGITTQPVTPPASVPLGSNGRASAKAVIVNQISVGVAITVGPLSQMQTRLEIPDVTGGAVGTTPRLYIQVHNTGQTFTKGRGKAACVVRGRTETVAITMDTVLPDDSAVLPVNAPALPAGIAVPCTVQLLYGAEKLATWSGLITIPAGAHKPVIPVGPGAFATPPAKPFPTWATVLIAAGAFTIAALSVAVVLLLRRRHNPTP